MQFNMKGMMLLPGKLGGEPQESLLGIWGCRLGYPGWGLLWSQVELPKLSPVQLRWSLDLHVVPTRDCGGFLAMSQVGVHLPFGWELQILLMRMILGF